MKRKIDDKGFLTPIQAGAVVIVILIAFLGFMVTGASDWGSADDGSNDDYNPITKEYYIDTSIDIHTSDWKASPELQNPTWSGESKRLNLEFSSFDYFKSFNGQLVCTLYIDNEEMASSSESVNMEDSWTGWGIDPNQADFSFGPIEREGSIDIRIVYELSFNDTDKGDKVEIKGTIS